MSIPGTGSDRDLGSTNDDHLSASPDPKYLRWLDEGNQQLRTTVQSCHDLSRDSLLPGWSRKHVVAHLARNADGIINLLRWAQTGIETPMYSEANPRDADIERYASFPDAALREEFAMSLLRFDEALSEMTSKAWGTIIQTAQGRRLPAKELPWIRLREVWIHSIDLDAGVSVADLPGGFAVECLTEASATLNTRAETPSAVLQSDDGQTWQLGSGEWPLLISGTTAELLGWLLGRTSGKLLRVAKSSLDVKVASEASLPPLPPWI